MPGGAGGLAWVLPGAGRGRTWLWALLLALALPLPVRGQSALAEACRYYGVPLLPGGIQVVPTCLMQAQAAMIAQSRVALVAAGGSPLPGNASTLGMRIGSTRRVALQLRVTGARVTLPRGFADTATWSSLASSFNADAAVAVFQGVSPAPTVGGIGGLDLLGSLGVLHGGGPLSGSPATFGLGARLGILRESFTTPGISLSAMYRRTGAVELEAPEKFHGRLSHVSDVAFRATVGKRQLPLGTTLGAGLDRTSGDATVMPVTAPLTQTRAVFFGDLTWTSLVFNGSAELGWQRGGSPATTSLPSGYEDLVRRRGVFGSLALRLTI